MPSPQPAPGPRIRIGCSGLPQGLKRHRFFEQLAFLETAATYFSLPKPSVLRRWRNQASEARPRSTDRDPGAGFSLVALGSITDPTSRAHEAGAAPHVSPGDHQVGHFRDTPAVRDATDAVTSASRILEAEVVLFRSTPDFTPSAANRNALQHYFDEIAPASAFGDAVRAWEPQGLWEPADAAQLCAELGVLYVCDPLERDPTAPEVDPTDRLPREAAYLRVTGLGRPRRALDEHTLESLLTQAQQFDRCWVVFATLEKRRDALAFEKLLSA